MQVFTQIPGILGSQNPPAKFSSEAMSSCFIEYSLKIRRTQIYTICLKSQVLPRLNEIPEPGLKKLLKKELYLTGKSFRVHRLKRMSGRGENGQL
jgi:hypothetical protein